MGIAKPPIDVVFHRLFRNKTTVRLDWTASKTPFSIEYEVMFKLSSDGEYSLAGTTTDVTYNIFSLQPDTEYDYKVTAISGGFVRSEPLEITEQKTADWGIGFPPLPPGWMPGK